MLLGSALAAVLEHDEDGRIHRTLVDAQQSAHLQGFNLGLVEHGALESVLEGKLFGAGCEFKAAELQHRSVDEVAGL